MEKYISKANDNALFHFSDHTPKTHVLGLFLSFTIHMLQPNAFGVLKYVCQVSALSFIYFSKYCQITMEQNLGIYSLFIFQFLFI